MTGERDDEATMALLNRLLETAIEGVPSGVFGRVSRLAERWRGLESHSERGDSA